MMKNAWICIVLILTFQGCQVRSNYFSVFKNDHIRPRQLDFFKVLNDSLICSIKNNNVMAVKSLMSNVLIRKAEKEIDSTVKLGSMAFSTCNYSILNQYLVNNSEEYAQNEIDERDLGDDSYSFKYINQTKDIFISLLIVHNKLSDYLITAIYGLENEKWTLNNLHFGPYKMYCKTAGELYHVAKLNYHKSHLIDAVDNMVLAKKCLRPVDEYFHYLKEHEMNEFYDKALFEANSKYHLPIVLSDISGNPRIIGIKPFEMDEGFFPMVNYISNINLSDTVSLRKEYEKIRTDVNNIFTGINTNKEYVLYRAYNELPDGINVVHHYGFVDEIGK